MRPTTFDEVIGNEKAVTTLKIATLSALRQLRPVPHILLYGPGGVGKTTLARIMANTLQSNFVPDVGNAIKGIDALVKRVIRVGFGGIMFVDEIHRLDTASQDLLLTLLEDYLLQTRDRMIHVPPFTFIGATTDPSMLNGPLKDRFPYHITLSLYSDDNIAKILRNTIQYAQYEEDAIKELVSLCRKNPRIAERLAGTKLRDFCLATDRPHIDVQVVHEFMHANNIYPLGLNENDVRYLRELSKHTYLPRNVLHARLGGDIIDESEHILRMHELIETQPGLGRTLTREGRKYLKSLGE